jgi:hypothetical protein
MNHWPIVSGIVTVPSLTRVIGSLAFSQDMDSFNLYLTLYEAAPGTGNQERTAPEEDMPLVFNPVGV